MWPRGRVCVHIRSGIAQSMSHHAGLAAVAVALVAAAGKSLIAKTATDRLTTFILVMSAAAAYVLTASWVFPALIIVGGATTLLYNTTTRRDMSMSVRPHGSYNLLMSLYTAISPL
jgi:chromate transport protein ChrA